MPTDTKTLIELRKITYAGIKDCQAALEEANGDIEKAIEVLRKKGALKAAKKADRTTNDGVVAIAVSPDNKKAAMAQVNCETDFVAKGEIFNDYAQKLADKGVESDQADLPAEFEKIKSELVIKLGENITFARGGIMAGEYIERYLHPNKKVGVLVKFSEAPEKSFAKDIAMQIAAANPGYIRPESVPGEELEKEKEIYREQLKNEGKPENIIEKIIIGKIQKYYQEVCLLNQPFVKDEEMTVGKYLKRYNEKNGQQVEIVDFFRYAI